MGRSGEYFLQGVTTDGAAARLTVDAVPGSLANPELLTENATRSMSCIVTGRQVAGSFGAVGDSATWCFWVQGARATGANTVTIDTATSMQTVLGLVSLTMSSTSMQPQISKGGGSLWRLAVSADPSSGSIALMVTGATNRTVSWAADIRYVEAA